jgi:hypothetical protein
MGPDVELNVKQMAEDGVETVKLYVLKEGEDGQVAFPTELEPTCLMPTYLEGVVVAMVVADE